MNLPPISRDKILPLTSLRFFLAFTLMLGHGFRNVPSLATVAGWLPNFLDHVFVLCPFFFFLSGFVLAWSHLRPLNSPGHASSGSIRIGEFWLTRFARLYPLCIAALLIDLPHYFHTRFMIPAAAGAGLPQILTNFAANLAMLQGWFPVYNSFGGANWAVSVEIFFYLLFPLMGPWLWRLTARSSWIIALLTYPAGLGLVAYAVHLNASLNFDILILKYNPILHVYEFVLGILLARVYVHLLSSPSRPSALAKFAIPAAALSTLAIACIMALPSLSEVAYMLLQHGLLMPLFALIILAFASDSHAICAVFSVPALVILGEGSYGIFLLHFPMFNIFRHAMLRYDWPVFAFVCAFIVALSVLSFYFFETPIRRLILSHAAAH